MIKEVLIFTAGAAIGAVSAYYLTKKAVESKYDGQLDAQRDYYISKYEKPLKKAPKKEEELKSITPNLPGREVYTKVIAESRERAKKEHEYVNYDRITAPEAPQDDEPGDIFIIPYDRFEGENADTEYDSQTLTWYEGDNMLTRPDDSIVDIVEYIGDNLKAFNGNDKEVIYVRNERHMVDYEVVRDPRNFTRDILGEDDDD